MKRKTLSTALLALCLLLTACGKEQEAAPAPLAGAAFYSADTSPCTLPLNDLSAACVSGESMYLAGTSYVLPTVADETEADVEDTTTDETEADGEVTTSTSSEFFSVSGVSGVTSDGEMTFSIGDHIQAALCRLDPVTGKAERLIGYAPEPGVNVMDLAPGPDGTLWVLEQNMGSSEDMMNSTNASSILEAASSARVWRQLSADGSQELARIDTAQMAGDRSVSASRVDEAGNVYLASGSTVTVLDGTGKTLFTCKGQEDILRLIPLSGGAVGALTANIDGARTVTPIDLEAQSWGAPCPLTGSASKIYPGNDTYEFLYISGDSLYGWPKGGTGPQKVLSWSASGIDCGQVYTMSCLPDGRAAALLWDDSAYPAASDIAILTPTDEDALAGRQVLTLATMGMSSETRAMVMNFNRTNKDYFIEIQDYSEFNTPDDASAGLTKLNTEILTGKMPDLLDVTDALPLRQYAAKGYLEDLWPYIESDPDLGRESVMERALQSAEIDGRLYQVFSSFSLDTLVGPSAIVGDRTGWSLPDLKAAMEKMPPDCGIVGQNETRSSIFASLFSRNLDSFVDWDTGTASFDSPAFREILEFCASFPAQPGASDDGLDAKTRAVEGRQLLLFGRVSSLTSVKIDRELFDGDVTYVGYPDGQGIPARFATGLETGGGLALSSACKDKEGAWSFLRRTLLPTGLDFFPSGFPISRTDFDAAVARDMEVEYATDENGEIITDENGEPVLLNMGRGLLGGRWIDLMPITQADYDQAMDLYENAGPLLRQDKNIYNIVQECVGGYFAGDRTLDDTIGAIQNRVALYLNEQK